MVSVPLRAGAAALLFPVFASAQEARPRPEIRVVELSGTPKERGETHGRVLKDEIRRLVAAWKDDLRRTHGDPDGFIRRFVEATSFDKAIDKWTPGLLDEVRGIAKGCGLDFETVYVFNLVDEVWAQGRAVADKCTAIGVDAQDGRPTLVAQNLDIPAYYHGAQTLLRIKGEKGRQAFVVTFPGLVGANGMNSDRIGVAVNTLLQLRPRPDGLPVAFVVRGLLQQTSWEAARRFLYDVDHASGQSYTLGGPDVAHCYECSAGRVVRCEAREGAPYTWHTNHPIASEDWGPAFLERAAARGKRPRDALDACPRFEELAGRLPDGVAPADVLAALASRDARVPICGPRTFACSVFSLGPEPELRLRAGPDPAREVRLFRFENRPK